MVVTVCILLSILSLVSGSTGPCRTWLFPCGTGDWRCTSVEMYQEFKRGPQPFCPSIETTPPPLPATYCSVVNGVCQFTNTTTNCTTWFNDCSVEFVCGTVEDEAAMSDNQCVVNADPPLQSKDLCVPWNESCGWYNPCQSWAGFCQLSYHCGTLDQYYEFLYGPQPLCAAPPPDFEPATPPGDCIIQDGACSWSNCTSWLDGCNAEWLCGTQYEEAVYKVAPIPPCLPRNDPPPQPADCAFDIDSGMCQFDFCPEGKVYTTCGTACPTTCSNFHSPPFCTLQCVSGCFCPQGTVEYGNDCVPPEDCPITDPCAAILCLPGHTCEVTADGNATCVLQCDCPDSQQCVYSEDALQAVCVDYPNVPCDSDVEALYCDGDRSRCLMQNNTKEIFCLDSCFIDNGGCDSDELCFTEVDGPCDSQSESCYTKLECEDAHHLSDYRCSPGWEYSTCGTACESTCETYLTQELTVCIQVCVTGCFCERGLVRFRDRCVDPRECYVLVNDPPPIDPLPLKPDVFLISLTSTTASLDDFKHLNISFAHSAGTIIREAITNYVRVNLHGYYYSSEGLQVVIEVYAERLSSNIAQVVTYIRDRSRLLPLQIESINIVETITISGRGLSGGAIAGIVVAAIGLLTAVAAFVVVLVVLVCMGKQRKIANTDDAKKDMLVAYAKMDTKSTKVNDEVNLPLEEKVDLAN